MVWVLDQFTGARVKKTVGQAVLALLETWEGMEIPTGQISEVLDLFKEVAAGHSLLPDKSEEVWIEAVRGFLHVGDIVRVRHNAFDGETGKYHNGRIGKVTTVRSGDAIFRSTDERTPFIDGAHYPIDKLERRIS